MKRSTSGRSAVDSPGASGSLSRAPAGCHLGVLAGPFFDGELPPGEARSFARHLRRCPACRAELRATHRLSLLLRHEGHPGNWGEEPEEVTAVERTEVPAARPSPTPSPRPSLVRGPALGIAGGCVE
jgi:anti-sigma factor RsiW